MATADGRGIPLDEYTKATPPGWKPHMQDYSLRLYLEKLRLWLRTTDIGTGDPAKVGPTVVGRLRGAAYRVVMKMRIPRQDGRILVGDEAIAALTENEIPENYAAGQPYLPGTPSGMDMLIQILTENYGALEHDTQALALEKFFGLYRGSGPLAEYCTAFRLRYEAAEEKAGLEINEVCKTHLFLTHAGLTQKFIDDIMLKVNGDRTQFQTIYNHVHRSGKQYQSHPDEYAGHMLYTEQEDDEDDYYNHIEYFTDFNGAWYIWDYDLEAAYYLDVAEEETQLFLADAWDYWDGVTNEEQYEEWANQCAESESASAYWGSSTQDALDWEDEDWEYCSDEEWSESEVSDAEANYFGRRRKGKGRRRKYGKGRRGKGRGRRSKGKGKGLYESPNASHYGRRRKGKGKGRRKGGKGKGKAF